MKKHILIFCILFYLIPLQVLAANTEIPVFNANGQKLPLNPSAYTENGTTMLPLRAVAEYLGAEVSWQPSDEISITKNDRQIFLNVGQTTARKNQGEQIATFSLSTVPLYKADTLFVPLRFIAEALDTPIKYCVNYQDNTKYPAIFLGESKYAQNYSFNDITKEFENNIILNQTQQALSNNDIYSWDEINLICSIFVRNVMGIYAETYNIPQSFGELSQTINNYYSFYISNEVLSSQDWQQYLALANHQCREMAISPIQIYVTEDKIYGTFGFELFAGFLFIPLLADVEITRCDDSLQAHAPTNPLQSCPYDLTDEGPETDSNGHMWRVTQISNVRSYINLQALHDNEPEIYAMWLTSENL